MPNRLANESSPYLLQHQNNPVDWYPWGPAALQKSQQENKPIFLSIGYSACHWCHVMEHESFENDRIADFLNEHFVSIKVDREERPDLDHIYMQCVMAIAGRGGWPLSAFLTPDQDFFYGGTYWPPQASRGMPGFDQVLARVLDAFHQQHTAVVEQSKQITRQLNSTVAASQHDDLEAAPAILQAAVDQMEKRFDETWGGFGGAPKFPPSMELSLLLRLYQQGFSPSSGSSDSLLTIANTTLHRMAYGGMFDHLGGGFARYSVDEKWLVPHFEKMLYDNAQLANAYLFAHQVTGQAVYRRIAEKTLDYLLRDMVDPEGGIYSSEDADSEGEEGKYYVWTPHQVSEVLGPELGERFCQLYDVTENGNFEGKSILNLPQSFGQFATQMGHDKSALQSEMREARDKLLAARSQRVPPGKDDKILTSWNGLAIDALARAAIITGNSAYLATAQRAAQFIFRHLCPEQGRLLHTARAGQARLNAYLDDYSYLINALVTLYQADHDVTWLERANQLAHQMKNHFSHDEGGFYYTSDDHESLIVRPVDFQDSSVPSGNSMAAMALLRLGRILNDSQWIDLAATTIRAALPLLEQSPLAGSQMLLAWNEWQQPGCQFVLVLPEAETEESEKSRAWLQKNVFPHQALLVRREGSPDQQTASSSIWSPSVWQGKTTRQGQPTLYICSNFQCEEPQIGHDAITRRCQVP